MKNYLFPLFALLIVGCGNRAQQSPTTESVAESQQVEQTDSIESAFPAVIEKEREVLLNDYPHIILNKDYKIEIWDVVKGDFNGDGRIDNACFCGITVHSYKSINSEEWEWYEDIVFDDLSIPSFGMTNQGHMRYCLLTNEGDLDKNGADEIAFFTKGGASTGMYRVNSLRNGQWEEIISVYTLINFNGIADETIVDIVRPDPQKKGYAIIKTMEWDYEIDWYKPIEESVKIK